MKRITILLALTLFALTLFAQTNTPRTLYVMALHDDMSPVLQAEQAFIQFEASISSSANVLPYNSEGFGFTFLGGNTYLKIQLGNYTNQWQAGDIITVNAWRTDNEQTGYLDNIIIPDTPGAIYWGRGGTHPGTPLIFTGGTPEFNLQLSSNYPGAAIFKDGVETGFETPHTFTGITADIAGIYSVVLDFVNWTNSPYTYEGLEDYTYHFIGEKVPANAMNPTPADGTVIDIEWDAEPVAYTLSWEAPADGPAPTHYNVWWQGEFILQQTELEWTTPAIEEGEYTWKIVPEIVDPAKGLSRSMSALQAKITAAPNTKAAGVGIDWHFTIVRGEEPIVDDYEEGTPTDYTDGDVTITITIGGGNANNIPPDPANPPAPVPNPSFVPELELNLQLVGAGPWTIVIETDAPWGSWYSYTTGLWTSVANVGGYITFVIPAGGKDIPIVPILLGGVDPTLPVELSYFAATLTAQNFVKLTWVSQSETEMLGYRVYRGKNEEQAASIMITPSMIAATNTSTTQTYTLEDKEVELGVTYWYWLESVDYGSSHFHGPSSIIVEGEVPPVLPEVTTMKNAYPNPFKTSKSTTIEVGIKAGETGTVTVYNILGQVVKTFKVTEGNHKITWNGKDTKGNACGSGIYFYKLSTPSVNQTKKMVIVK